MFTKSQMACERSQLEKLQKLQLPNSFKRIGFAVTILSFIGLFVNKFSIESTDVRLFLKYGMLVGLLVVSVSKEKIEDELIAKLRAQSYGLAFIIGVVFTLAQPFANYFFDSLLGAEPANFKETGDFEILWMLLSVQVFYFYTLKRFYK